MPEPRYRSRSKRRKQIKVPGGENKLHYEKFNPGVAKCANCKAPMNSIPRKNVVDLKRLPKVQKRPTRMYGGYLCPKCLKEALKNSVKNNE